MLFEATIEKVNTKALKIGRETEVVLTVDTYRSLVADLSLLVNSRVTIQLNPQQYEMSIDVKENGDKELVPAPEESEDVGKAVAEAIAAPCANCGHEESQHPGGGYFCMGDGDECRCTEYVRPESAAETIEILTGAILGTEPGGAEDDEAREMVKEILGEGGQPVEVMFNLETGGLMPVKRTIDDMVADVLAEGMVETLSGEVVG
jgi:hypothetical protein